MSTPDESAHDWDSELAALTADDAANGQATDGVDPGTIPAQRGPHGREGRAADDAETLVVDPGAGRLGASVDRPGEYVPLSVQAQQAMRRPIVPDWARSIASIRSALRWWARYAAYVTGYHATRTPKYGLKTAGYAVVGSGRLTGRMVRWARAEEHNWQLRQHAADHNDARTWMELDVRRQRQTRFRWTVTLTTFAAVGAGVAVLLVGAGFGGWSWWWDAAVACLVAPLLARAGRPVDKPITDRITLGERFIKLTGEMTRHALMVCGVAGIKDPGEIKFMDDIGRDGPGFMARVALPPGVVATDVIDKRDRLAAGLKLPMDQVWPETVRGEHPGRLNIWVADKPVSAMNPPAWPLLTEGTTDYFKPLPYGADVRMRPVEWKLSERNSLFGGMPGSGKSAAARGVMLGAVLDPLVIPVVSELKGIGDFEMFEPLCPDGLYVSGADEGAIKRTINIVQWLINECETRPALIAKYARQGLNDVKKLNRAMAERDDRLRPVVAIFDEIQEAITHPEHGKAIAAMLTSIVKRGRALGIHIILCTQRLDKESLPKGITSNVSNRAALAVPSHTETNLILGTSAYQAGARPTDFVPEDDAGWMVRFGFAPGFQTVKSAFINDPQAYAICARALALRQGLAVDAPAVPTVTRHLLTDLRDIWPAGETAVWSELLVPRLRELDATVYVDLDVTGFGQRMAKVGLPTTPIHRKINGEGYTRAGIRRKALDERLDRLGDDTE